MKAIFETLNKFIFFQIVLIILLSVDLAFSGSKDEKDPIDKWLDRCIEKDYSTLGVVKCYDEAIDMWDVELNRVYKKLMKSLKPNERKLLRASQREWVKFKEKEFEFLNSYPYMNNNKVEHGTMSLIVVQERKLDIIKHRTLELKEFLDFVNFKY